MEKEQKFHEIILAHLDAAYNYAYWLTRSAHDAEDLTQEACTRAYAAFDRFGNGNPKAWLLTIVRHTFLTEQEQQKRRGEVIYLDTLMHNDSLGHAGQDYKTPESILLSEMEAQHLVRCINELPEIYREILILRELEGMCYSEIAEITDTAIGTVMSRLSRARAHLKERVLRTNSTREVKP